MPLESKPTNEPYTITLTLIVRYTDDDGAFIVTGDPSEAQVYGEGDTPYRAVSDFLKTLGSNMEDIEALPILEARQDYALLTAWVEGRTP